jgi:hypothetical protein
MRCEEHFKEMTLIAESHKARYWRCPGDGILGDFPHTVKEESMDEFGTWLSDFAEEKIEA